MDHVVAIENKEEFQAAIKEKNLNLRVELLGELYGRIVEEEGDLGRGVAPVAFEYGDANLRLAVESNNEFVNAELKKRAEKKDQVSEPEKTKDSEQEENENENEEEEEPSSLLLLLNKDDILELFEISWECLDTCRVIYERMSSEEQDERNQKQIRSRIAETMMRLGDLKIEQGQFEESIPEFQKCLEIRVRDEPESSRNLATAHHSLGMAHEFAASEKPDINHRIQAAVHFAKAQAALRLNRHQLLSNSIVVVVQPPSSSSNGVYTETTVEGGRGKKKLVRSRRWISSLTPDQLEAVDEAFVTSAAPLLPPKMESDSPEAKEVADLIQDLAGKVDDVTFDLTEEGTAEEKAKLEEESKKKASEPIESIGFDSIAAAPQPQQPVVSNGEAVLQPNVLQPRKREKLIPQSVHPTTNLT